MNQKLAEVAESEALHQEDHNKQETTKTICYNAMNSRQSVSYWM